MATSVRARGGVSRSAVAELAAGGFLLLAGIVFLVPFLVDTRPEQNDVFMSNLLVGPLYCAIGSTLFIAGFAGLGLNRWITFALAVVNPVAAVLGAQLVQSTGVEGIPAISTTLLADAGVLIAASVLVAGVRRQWRAWEHGLVLAAISGGLMSWLYSVFGERFVGATGVDRSLPPFVGMPVLGISLAPGIAVFILGRVWRSGRRV